MTKYKNKYKPIKNLYNKNTLVLANLHITCSFKNTIISLTKINGELLKQWSTKSLKKTKFKKNTPYNIQLLTHQVCNYALLKKIKKFYIFFKGTNLGSRNNILHNLKKRKFKSYLIFDKTAIPFNGCRKKKQRRR